MNRRDFQELARVRLAEAKVLLDNGLYDGAYYLCGYVVECALKACICRQFRLHDFPPEPRVVADMYTHDFVRLVGRAGLAQMLQTELQTDPTFQAYWNTVSLWSERSRYERQPADSAEELYKAVADRQRGVLKWLRRHW